MTQWIFAGADISAKTIEVCVKLPSGTMGRLEVANDLAGHRQLVRHLTKKGQHARVCLESTGFYGLDLALMLHRAARIEVMVLNPRAARRYAEVLMMRSKTDVTDGQVLCDYAERMEFEPWNPPSVRTLALRTLGRRIHQLVQLIVAEKNRLHAVELSDALKVVRNDIEVNIRHLKRRVAQLEGDALELIGNDLELSRTYNLLITARGIASSSAVRLLAELAPLPKNMTPRQWVAQAGLDPRQHQSGSSILKKAHLSKAGNHYLRSALYMPAHNMIQHEPRVKAFSQRLRERGKHPLQAKAAVMRKLLHAIHGMIQNDEAFVPEKFCHLPEERRVAA